MHLLLKVTGFIKIEFVSLKDAIWKNNYSKVAGLENDGNTDIWWKWKWQSLLTHEVKLQGWYSYIYFST